MRIPSATYRLQVNREVPLPRVTASLDYLDALGVSDVYLSPLLAAVPGSSHGYDVIDHGRLNPDLGTEADLVELGERLRARGMGLLSDVVPNHMCIAGTHNRWWLDVLENGPSSAYARFFDIDWAPPKPDLAAKVLLPVLGDQYGRVLEAGQIQVAYDDGAFVVHASGATLPLAPRSWPLILEPVLTALRAAPRIDELDELESILWALSRLPPRTEVEPVKVRERRREKKVVRRRLAALLRSSAPVRAAVDRALVDLNGVANDPRSFDGLDALLAEQAYRLSFWRVAADEINYRRFFDINDLAAIRVEDPAVFASVHGLLMRFVGAGVITGLRVDHIDGLWSPARYLHDLQRACRASVARAGVSSPGVSSPGVSAPGVSVLPPSPVAGGSAPPGDTYVVVEKILEPGEDLRPIWPIQGTTGYDFLNTLGGVFVDLKSARRLAQVYTDFTGVVSTFPDIAYESKKLILDVSLSSELTVLARRLDRISEQHRYSLDFTLRGLQDALAEVVACFPVYRTYVEASDEPAVVHEDDRAHIEVAVREAKRRNPAVSESIYDFVRDVLLLRDPEGIEPLDRAERREFVRRFQQLTGPAVAKGLEDTAFYRYYPLASLNEVGGSPARFGVSVAAFHALNQARMERTPHALSATSTHDTKRSEDVRARISVLSEDPEGWARAIGRWSEANARHKTEAFDALVPDANEEYLLYQTLVGTWPLEPLDDEGRRRYVERMQRYMDKALKEAKLHTSWVRPNDDYDRAVRAFVEAILTPSPDNRFLSDFMDFQTKIARPGLYGALSQALLKIASPGVPDFYQGSELFQLTLVDPDNRDPVDLGHAARLLTELRRDAERGMTALCKALVTNLEDGRAKLHVTSRALRFRRARRALFDEGAYTPLDARGEREGHVVAFARTRGDERAVVVAARFFVALGASERAPVGASWSGTHVRVEGRGRYRDVLTGETHEVREDGVLPLDAVLGHLPVALLEKLS
jgi:(1->4)-alpha-D-glucan 1-alpha-D-glucosylmutase